MVPSALVLTKQLAPFVLKECVSVFLLDAVPELPPLASALETMTSNAARTTNAIPPTEVAPACRHPNAVESLTLATALVPRTYSAV